MPASIQCSERPAAAEAGRSRSAGERLDGTAVLVTEATSAIGAAVALAARRNGRQNVNEARREALFASGLQPSDAPTAERVAEAIDRTVRQFGVPGCIARMAQEFGDHPDQAAKRMRWVRQLIAEAPAPPQARAGPGPRCWSRERGVAPPGGGDLRGGPAAPRQMMAAAAIEVVANQCGAASGLGTRLPWPSRAPRGRR
jgi:hypothetical protein